VGDVQETAQDGQPVSSVMSAESWTPEHVRQFQEAWDEFMRSARPAAQQIVLHIWWTEGSTARQETYGPWTATGDESHLEQIVAFMRDWQRLTGCVPSSVTMALVQDPAAWAREREPVTG
jgi:hypothetical protein